jgi:hypothetical protein
MSVICPICDKEFQEIGKHWYGSKCEYPSFSDKQKEIITGLLMGDGSVCVQGENSNPNLSCGMIRREYLEYLNEEVFPVIGSKVHLKRTAEEQAKYHVESGFRINAEASDYQDVYSWYTRNHPGLKPFKDWYSSGEKVFPDDIDLTPLVLKHWYVGDGNFETEKYSVGRISIATSNEIDNRSKIENYFDSIGFDEHYWESSKREDGSLSGSIRFSTELTEDIFEYMGEPLPGFEYKWPKMDNK